MTRRQPVTRFGTRFEPGTTYPARRARRALPTALLLVALAALLVVLSTVEAWSYL
jgi:hypothetical protein